jgi:RNA polymerase sigma-70 factor (ECF subfamily)
MNEALLIADCRKQEGKAQRAVFDAYADPMLTLCVRYLKNTHEAEDALLRGFEKFFRSLGRFEYRGDGSIRAYLKQIMVRECLMSMRQTRRLVFLEEREMDYADTGTDLFGGLQAKDIFRLIAELPDGYRTVFNLYEVEGYSHQQIATDLGVSVGTCKSQLSKAKAALRQRLTQIEGDYARR